MISLISANFAVKSGISYLVPVDRYPKGWSTNELNILAGEMIDDAARQVLTHLAATMDTLRDKVRTERVSRGVDDCMCGVSTKAWLITRLSQIPHNMRGA